MALTSAEEALVRELIAQNAALLSLADNEATITSKLGAAIAELSDLAPSASVAGGDLMLIRQGTTDKSITPAVLMAPLFGDAGLAALTDLVPAADRVPYFTGTGTSALATLTASARTLLSQGNYAAMRALLDVEPGVDVQAYDTDLAAIAALATTAFGRSLLTLADNTELSSQIVTTAGSSGSRSVTIGGFTVTVRDISPTANSVAAFTYGAGHVYSSWARAWVEGDDNPIGTSSDRSVWINATPTVSFASVRNDGDSTATCWLFSIGI